MEQDIFQGCFTFSFKKVYLTLGFTAYKAKKTLVKSKKESKAYS